MTTPRVTVPVDCETLLELHTLKGWLHGLANHMDLCDVVADGGVTAGMAYQQEATEFAGRLRRILDGPLSAAPAPSSLAGGEVMRAAERLRNIPLSDGGGGYASAVMDAYGHEPVHQFYMDLRAILAALSPEAPASLCAHGHTDPMALCSDCEADSGAGDTIEARFPELNDDLIRMASTGNTGSLTEWGRFIERLQSALRAQPPASPSTLAELHAAERLIDQQAAEIRRLKAREDAQPVADAVEPIELAIAAMKGHISAIQVAKRGGGSSSLITDCINSLPEIVRWVEGGLFNVEAAFEQYEATPPAPEAEKLRASDGDVWSAAGCPEETFTDAAAAFAAAIEWIEEGQKERPERLHRTRNLPDVWAIMLNGEMSLFDTEAEALAALQQEGR